MPDVTAENSLNFYDRPNWIAAQVSIVTYTTFAVTWKVKSL
jgi:hypothetical protein